MEVLWAGDFFPNYFICLSVFTMNASKRNKPIKMNFLGGLDIICIAENLLALALQAMVSYRGKRD